MKTVDAAVGKWGLIFDHYNLPPIEPARHHPGECPICGSKGKLRIDDKDGTGTWICVCGAGSGFDLLTQATGRDFGELAREVDRIIGNNFEPTSQPVGKEDRIVSTFKSLSSLRASDGQNYLLSRGISTLPQGGSKWHPGVECRDLGRKVPAIWSIASDPLGRPAKLHCTFIESGKKIQASYQRDGDAIPFPTRKMITVTESHGPIAIKLAPVGETLGIAEGIETALSASQLFAMPVWSVLNASLMRRFRPPGGVKCLVIFADNDRRGAGLAAAMHAASCSLHSKNDLERVRVLWPKALGDFNDVLIRGDDVLEHTLIR